MRKVFEKSAFIMIKNKRILVARSDNNTIFFLPGGARNESECQKEALIREVKEELNLDIEPGSIRFIASFKSPTFEDPNNSDVILNCFTGKYKGLIRPSSEVKQIDWFTYKNRDKVSPADQKVFDYLKNFNLIE